METRLDRFGRVVLPKAAREALGLRPGATLAVEEGEDAIVLRPLRGEPNVVEKGGVLVFTGSAAGDVGEAVRAHRRERLASAALRRRR